MPQKEKQNVNTILCKSKAVVGEVGWPNLQQLLHEAALSGGPEGVVRVLAAGHLGRRLHGVSLRQMAQQALQEVTLRRELACRTFSNSLTHFCLDCFEFSGVKTNLPKLLCMLSIPMDSKISAALTSSPFSDAITATWKQNEKKIEMKTEDFF